VQNPESRQTFAKTSVARAERVCDDPITDHDSVGGAMVARLIAHTLIWCSIMAATLFAAAGTLAWSLAWVFLAEMAVLFLICGGWLARRDPALLAERLAPPIQTHQTAADRILLTIFIIAMFGALALMALDAVRFKWSSVPRWVQAIGEIILLLSMWICVRTLSENTFAAPVVKIQEDRGQSVITTGPYRIVRHPLYSGTILFFVGTTLLLGAWWGLAATLVLVVLLGIRIRFEEKALRNGLAGYGAYMARVRYRLIPLVW
jgi:protein-S-isoprenylcysteine O-methyltransferase Ste14